LPAAVSFASVPVGDIFFRTSAGNRRVGAAQTNGEKILGDRGARECLRVGNGICSGHWADLAAPLSHRKGRFAKVLRRARQKRVSPSTTILPRTSAGCWF